MVDFAKTLFGFSGGLHKNEDKQHLQQQQQQQHNDDQLTPLQSSTHSISSTSGVFPNFQHISSPTTALSENSFAYGTTTKSNEYQPQEVLSRVASNPKMPNSQTTSTTASINTELEKSDVSIPKRINATSNDSSNTTRGKLKINIIEAKNLLTRSSNAQPYVVCTFESSEFISHGPESVDNHPASNNAFLKNNRSIPTSKRPLYSRQSSSQHLNRGNQRISENQALSSQVDEALSNNSNPVWHHEAIFDVIGTHSELDISVYDSDDTFLGHVTLKPGILSNSQSKEWFKLESRIGGDKIEGEIKVSWEYQKTRQNKIFGPQDFEVLRLLGKGTFGQVFQVRKLDTDRIYAMKVLSKKVIVKKKEIAHTIGERNILVRTAGASSPFIVGLKFSFQTPTDLYLVTDYMSGGELFWHLQKEGRFSEDRAKFYIAELILSLEHLHDNGIVYRDLKPENILLDANGHIALCDFGLSKADLSTNDTTNTFCGTTEYLAPEVLLDESGYTKMVDFWSLGVLIFEMCCGWSPFFAENTQQMYKNIAFGKVRFPKEVLSAEGRSFVKGLLNRNPKHRLGSQGDARELRAHPFFNDIDWDLLRLKKIPPPFKPHISSETDTSNFDPEFTNTSASLIHKQFQQVASTPLSPGIQANFKGFTFVDESTMEDLHRRHQFQQQPYGSLIPGNPHLPPEEDVIEEDGEEDEQIDRDGDHEMDDDEFVNGQFDL
jgi:protein-serine/threonine kinase